MTNAVFNTKFRRKERVWEELLTTQGFNEGSAIQAKILKLKRFFLKSFDQWWGGSELIKFVYISKKISNAIKHICSNYFQNFSTAIH